MECFDYLIVLNGGYFFFFKILPVSQIKAMRACEKVAMVTIYLGFYLQLRNGFVL